VARDLLQRVVAAATWAPNGGNLQLYDFIVVTDRAQVARLGALWREVESKYMAMLERLARDIFTDPDAQAVRDSIRYQAEHFDETPAVIAACYSQPPRADPRVLVEVLRAVGPRFLTRVANPRLAAVQGAASSYPGVQNLLLAARALGLAANLSTWHLWAQEDFKRVHGVPKQTTIYALVPLGWPAGRFGPVRRRPVVDALHWDRWWGQLGAPRPSTSAFAGRRAPRRRLGARGRRPDPGRSGSRGPCVTRSLRQHSLGRLDALDAETLARTRFAALADVHVLGLDVAGASARH